MYTHLTIGSNDLEKSRQFYDAIFTAAGGKPGTAIPDMGRVVYAHNGNVLIVTTPINGEPATFGNGITIGIGIGSPAEVEAWHAAGVANGGVSCEDAPGVRENPGMPKMHLAYLRDPDGNKLCALYRYPAE